MPCYKPICAFRSCAETSSGKRKVVFSSSIAKLRSLGSTLPSDALILPCGQCIGCRLERSRQWAVRCVHEASLYDDNCFVTLTYSPEALPVDGSLRKEDFQKFMKRLRFKYGKGVRYYHCGEYGESFRRPHYHACLFNFDFIDKRLYKTVNGNNLYISDSLSELWPYGFTLIGGVSFQSAAYVARYICKKIFGKDAESHYGVLKPEYTTMSRKPGIGSAWLEKYKGDVYPHDFVVVNGRKMKPPKYYDTQFEVVYPEEFSCVKERRLQKAELCLSDNTPERLLVKEKKKNLDVQLLIRNFERGDL